jgi:hypothetical protein
MGVSDTRVVDDDKSPACTELRSSTLADESGATA